MTDVVEKLWGFCHTLRHDGIDYGDYIEQITYLLFLKMADERGIELPDETRLAVPAQAERHRADSTTTSTRCARSASSRASSATSSRGAQSRFNNPVNLKKLIGLIDETEWTRLDVDVKAAAFEGCWRRPRARGRRAPASTSRRAS